MLYLPLQFSLADTIPLYLSLAMAWQGPTNFVMVNYNDVCIILPLF